MLTLQPSQTASQRALVRGYPLDAATNLVLGAVCWTLGRAGTHPAEVGEGPRHYPNSLRGTRFFNFLLWVPCRIPHQLPLPPGGKNPSGPIFNSAGFYTAIVHYVTNTMIRSLYCRLSPLIC